MELALKHFMTDDPEKIMPKPSKVGEPIKQWSEGEVQEWLR
jgi:predicted DNA-binding transcriptional regulator AlpA